MPVTYMAAKRMVAGLFPGSEIGNSDITNTVYVTFTVGSDTRVFVIRVSEGNATTTFMFRSESGRSRKVSRAFKTARGLENYIAAVKQTPGAKTKGRLVLRLPESGC